MTYTFLLLDLFLLLIPFALAIDNKASVIGNLKIMSISSLIVTVFFSEIAVFLTGVKTLVFNPAYLIGLVYRGLPLEEYLFLFTFSFAGLGIYNYLNSKFLNNNLQKYALAVSHLMIGVCIAMLFFAYTKWYSVFTFSSLILLLIAVEYINVLRFMYKFYRTFLVALIPFYISYALLSNLPIISYDPKETLGFDLAKIPFESHFYMMAMLLLAVYILEVLNKRLAK